ncbi:UNVERIFIED_CONTAM: hypothetical protein MXL98_14265 [Staphylococcus pseudoxylosus]
MPLATMTPVCNPKASATEVVKHPADSPKAKMVCGTFSNNSSKPTSANKLSLKCPWCAK